LALADGRSLPASVLASEAGIAPSTASHHLARLVSGGLLSCVTRGRHRYFALAGPDVAELLEAAARVAPTRPVTSLREGTRAHALRYARRCYDHLAGRVGVAVAEALEARRFLVASDSVFTVTAAGVSAFADLGVPADAGETARTCRDWTEQRSHIAGPLGRALLFALLERGWLEPELRTRALRVTPAGEDGLSRLGVELT
jgi:DNA-binding transcriptional ArsR family regulator